MAQSTRWVFTLNNPTTGEEQLLRQNLDNDAQVKYAVVGRETGANGTPHLQGFVIFVSRLRPRGVKQLLGNRCHIEVAKGNNKQASDYCKKDGDFDEYGQYSEDRGKRTDIDDAIEWGDAFIKDNGRPPNDQEIALAHPKTYIKFPRLCECIRLRFSPPPMEDGTPREWQRKLADELDGVADDRQIWFYLDESGGKGKTWFCRWMLSKRNDVQVVGAGKKDDIAYMLDTSKRIFLFNVPRGGMEYFNYVVVEQLKDRLVMSGKYESKMKTWSQKVHVIVFCNEHPDMHKMSQDRYVVITDLD